MPLQGHHPPQLLSQSVVLRVMAVLQTQKPPHPPPPLLVPHPPVNWRETLCQQQLALRQDNSRGLVAQAQPLQAEGQRMGSSARRCSTTARGGSPGVFQCCQQSSSCIL
jgi:hypothetical protein